MCFCLLFLGVKISCWLKYIFFDLLLSGPVSVVSLSLSLSLSFSVSLSLWLYCVWYFFAWFRIALRGFSFPIKIRSICNHLNYFPTYGEIHGKLNVLFFGILRRKRQRVRTRVKGRWEQLLLLLFFIICAWYFWMTLSQHLVSSLSQGIFSSQLYFCFADVVFEALVLSIFLSFRSNMHFYLKRFFSIHTHK